MLDVSKPTDLFSNLDALKVAQDYSTCGVKRVLTTIPIRKPAKEWFVRTHPEHRLTTRVIVLKEEGETYLISPTMSEALSTESTCGLRNLVLATNRQGVAFLWPLRLPDLDGKFDDWGRSETEAAASAETKWIRLQSDKSLGAYVYFEATGTISEPTWPDLSFSELLRIAFKDRIIETADHPILRKLRGEV